MGIFRTAFLVTLAIVAAGCNGHGGVFKGLQVQLVSEPVSLDPALAEDGASLRILTGTMEGLMGYDGGGRLVQRLARTVSVNKAGTAYEFSLRPDARWSDGRAVTAADFVVAFRRSLSPDTPSKLASLLFPIRNAKAYHAGKAKASLLGVSERAGNLVIELERPVAYWLDVLTLPPAMPSREDVLLANHGRWPETAPVTGPYRIAYHKAEQQLLLEPNPEHSRLLPLPVLFRVVRDESTGVALFERGLLDILAKVPELDQVRLSGKGVIRTEPFVATYFLSFNTRKAPFDDVRFRRAISGAIRRGEITAAMATGETPARSWIPRGLEGYIPWSDPVPVFAADMKAVKALASSVPPIPAEFDSGARNAMILEKVQQDVLRTLGLRLSLTQMDWKAHVASISADAPALFRFGWMAPFMDPISHLEAFRSDNPNNYTGWKNAEYDRLVDDIGALPRGAVREAKIRQAQEVLVDREAIVVPIYHYVQTFAVSPRVRNFRVNSFGMLRFDEMSVE